MTCCVCPWEDSTCFCSALLELEAFQQAELCSALLNVPIHILLHKVKFVCRKGVLFSWISVLLKDLHETRGNSGNMDKPSVKAGLCFWYLVLGSKIVLASFFFFFFYYFTRAFSMLFDFLFVLSNDTLSNYLFNWASNCYPLVEIFVIFIW